jgi:hypothetical protein
MSAQPRYGGPANGTPQSASFVSQQNVLPFNLPPAQYSNGHNVSQQQDTPHSYAPTTSAEYSEAAHQQSAEMMMLGQMAMPGTVPMFGGDGGLTKSPYVGMPEDFLTYLFNSSPGGEKSPMADPMRSGPLK